MNPKESISPRGGAVTGLVQSVEVSLFWLYLKYFIQFLIPVSMSAISCPTELYTQESARSIHSPNLTSSWIVFGFLAYTILYSFSCEARFKSLLPHLRSMRSNRFMWDLQKITRSRIMILSINRPEDAGIWKSKDWRLHDTLKSQCFTMSNL